MDAGRCADGEPGRTDPDQFQLVRFPQPVDFRAEQLLSLGEYHRDGRHEPSHQHDPVRRVAEQSEELDRQPGPSLH